MLYSIHLFPKFPQKRIFLKINYMFSQYQYTTTQPARSAYFQQDHTIASLSHTLASLSYFAQFLFTFRSLTDRRTFATLSTMPISPTAVNRCQDANERNCNMVELFLSDLPADVEKEHIDVILSLSMGHTLGHTADLTGYCIQHISELSGRYKVHIQRLRKHRNDVLSGLCGQLAYSLVQVGLQSVAKMVEYVKSNRATPGDLSSISKAAEIFRRMQKEINEDQLRSQALPASRIHDVSDALAMLPSNMPAKIDAPQQ